MKTQSCSNDDELDRKNKTHHVFMGCNESTISMLPSGLGMHFPAFLTHKNGVDISLIDLMRPLFDSGLRVLSFQKMLKELHAKEHYRLMLCRECEVMDRISRSMPNEFDSECFRNFQIKKSTTD